MIEKDKSNAKSEFIYFDVIIKALERLYQNDGKALLGKSRKVHEQTLSFRLAHYLASALEEGNTQFFVDCEYHGDVRSEDGKKMLQGKHIRPDILYHDRAISDEYENEFCIEMKKGTMQKDYKKVSGCIRYYDYKEGYCIYNMGPNFVTVNVLTPDCKRIKGIPYRFKYDAKEKQLKQTTLIRRQKRSVYNNHKK